MSTVVPNKEVISSWDANYQHWLYIVIVNRDVKQIKNLWKTFTYKIVKGPLFLTLYFWTNPKPTKMNYLEKFWSSPYPLDFGTYICCIFQLSFPVT